MVARMKPSRLFAGTALAVSLFTHPVTAQNVNALLSIQTSPSSAAVKIIDAANNAWSIQTSSNFVDWTEIEIIKVYNGAYECGGKPILPGNIFYRATVSGAAFPNV